MGGGKEGMSFLVFLKGGREDERFLLFKNEGRRGLIYSLIRLRKKRRRGGKKGPSQSTVPGWGGALCLRL